MHQPHGNRQQSTAGDRNSTTTTTATPSATASTATATAARGNIQDLGVNGALWICLIYNEHLHESDDGGTHGGRTGFPGAQLRSIVNRRCDEGIAGGNRLTSQGRVWIVAPSGDCKR